MYNILCSTQSSVFNAYLRIAVASCHLFHICTFSGEPDFDSNKKSRRKYSRLEAKLYNLCTIRMYKCTSISSTIRNSVCKQILTYNKQNAKEKSTSFISSLQYNTQYTLHTYTYRTPKWMNEMKKLANAHAYRFITFIVSSHSHIYHDILSNTLLYSTLSNWIENYSTNHGIDGIELLRFIIHYTLERTNSTKPNIAQRTLLFSSLCQCNWNCCGNNTHHSNPGKIRKN